LLVILFFQNNSVMHVTHVCIHVKKFKKFCDALYEYQKYQKTVFYLIFLYIA